VPVGFSVLGERWHAGVSQLEVDAGPPVSLQLQVSAGAPVDSQLQLIPVRPKAE
jgi:hypothetical protein